MSASAFGVDHDAISKGVSCGCSCKSCKDDKSCSCDCAHCKPGSRGLRKNAYCDYSMADKSMIGKASATQKKPSLGRTATAVAFPWIHAATAGKKGRKLNAAATMSGHSLVGTALGATAGEAVGAVTRTPEIGGVLRAVGGTVGGAGARVRGVYRNQAKGNYQVEKVAPERIAKASELLAAAKRPTDQNTRRQNVAVGTGVGAATGAGIGTALGGLVGSQRATGGLRALKSVGAAPSRLRRAEITAREAGRLGRKGGAVFGALGAAAGLQEGLTAPAKRKARKSAYEVS